MAMGPAGRFIGAGDGAVTPGSRTLAAAGAVPAPASIRTAAMAVIGMASLPNLMASPYKPVKNAIVSLVKAAPTISPGQGFNIAQPTS